MGDKREQGMGERKQAMGGRVGEAERACTRWGRERVERERENLREKEIVGSSSVSVRESMTMGEIK